MKNNDNGNNESKNEMKRRNSNENNEIWKIMIMSEEWWQSKKTK